MKLAEIKKIMETATGKALIAGSCLFLIETGIVIGRKIRNELLYRAYWKTFKDDDSPDEMYCWAWTGCDNNCSDCRCAKDCVQKEGERG